MTGCPDCGAAVKVATVVGDSTPSRFDVHEAYAGPNRYVERDVGMVAVRPAWQGAAFRLHDCTKPQGTR